MVKPGLLDQLAAGPVICAEGYLFELERRGYLQAGAYVPEVVLDFPEQVENLHRDFLRAGSDVSAEMRGFRMSAGYVRHLAVDNVGRLANIKPKTCFWRRKHAQDPSTAGFLRPYPRPSSYPN
jgi:hypothetical protein